MIGEIEIPVLLDGRLAQLKLSGDALRAAAVAAAEAELVTEKPIEGYQALAKELARAGVKRHPKTLERWTMAGKLPCRRFNGRARFYLAEVLRRLKGE